MNYTSHVENITIVTRRMKLIHLFCVTGAHARILQCLPIHSVYLQEGIIAQLHAIHEEYKDALPITGPPILDLDALTAALEIHTAMLQFTMDLAIPLFPPPQNDAVTGILTSAQLALLMIVPPSTASVNTPNALEIASGLLALSPPNRYRRRVFEDSDQQHLPSDQTEQVAATLSPRVSGTFGNDTSSLSDDSGNSWQISLSAQRLGFILSKDLDLETWYDIVQDELCIYVLCRLCPSKWMMSALPLDHHCL